MTKPKDSLEVSTPCDLSPVGVEEAIEKLSSTYSHPEKYRVSAMRFIAKVGLGSAMSALRILQPYGIPVQLEDNYNIYEWSIYVLVYTNFSGVVHLHKAEMWSPGA